MLLIRTSKIILALAVGFWGLLGLFGNLVAIPAAYSDVETVTSMVAVPDGEGPPFGTTNPIIVWLGVLAIILGKVVAIIAGVGGVMMARQFRGSQEAFASAKTLAIAGCGLAFAVNWVAFNIFAETVFFSFMAGNLAMVGEVAFRYAAAFALAAIYIAQAEPS